MSPGAENENWYSYLVMQRISILTLEMQWVGICKAVHRFKMGKTMKLILVLLVNEMDSTWFGNYVCITCQIPLQNMSLEKKGS